MQSTEEPTAKRKATDFTLCIHCQSPKSRKGGEPEPLIKPKWDSYNLFLTSVYSRAEYDNPLYVTLKNRLQDLSAQDLELRKAVWHKTCYGEATHKQHIERDKERYEKAIACGDTAILTRRKKGRPSTLQPEPEAGSSTSAFRPVTRSVLPAFRRDFCFFCQSEKDDQKTGKVEKLYQCRSYDRGLSLQEIVSNSNNETWKVNLADIIAEGDLHARDITYHTSCYTSNWSRFIQAPQRLSTSKPDVTMSVGFIAAEIELYAEMQEDIDEGLFVKSSDAETMYRNMMRDHGICSYSITRKLLLNKIRENVLCEITESKGQQPSLIHSKVAQNTAIHDAQKEQNIKEDMTYIQMC